MSNYNSTTLKSQESHLSKWLRVSKNSPCPICSKPDWCLVSRDGNACICARIESDSKAGDAGWLHKLNGSPAEPQTQRLYNSELKRGEPQALDAVYTALLGELELSSNHKQALKKRGLSPQEIKRSPYKSLERVGRPALVQRLAVLVHDGKLPVLAGVPGFYMESVFDITRPNLAGSSGMLIPVRNTQGHIVALLIRSDNSKARRYSWLSSSGKEYGCGSGAPVHVARPQGKLFDKSLAIVTEGALKADIVADRLGVTCLGVAGVGSWHDVPAILRELGIAEVITAYDMDKLDNMAVKRHAGELSYSLLDAGYTVYEASWPKESKGLDDYLLSIEASPGKPRKVKRPARSLARHIGQLFSFVGSKL